MSRHDMSYFKLHIPILMKSPLLFLIALFLSIHLQAQVWSPDGKKIAFFYIHAIEDIYLVNPDGSQFEVIEKHPERDFAPQWSPDGQNLVFTSVRDGHHEVYLFNLEGKCTTKLTESEFNSEDGSYSPDGNKIIFSSDRTGNVELYSMDKCGGNIQQITFTPDFDERTPRWSTDGNKILFVGNPKGEKFDVWSMDADGKNRINLTNTPDSEFHHSISPDGKWLSYIKVFDGAFEIHVMDLNGENDRVLLRKKGYQAFFPHWSPDGKQIAFTRDVMEGTAPGLPALYVVDLEGNERLVSDKNSFKK